MEAVCMSGEALGALLVHLETLEARVAELSRPKEPADYGLHVAFTPTERRLVMALLPPGDSRRLGALIARVWPECVAAGLLDESAHLVRVHMARVRERLWRAGSAWRVPESNGHGEYVLLAPGDALPVGFRESRSFRAACVPKVVPPCPECGGHKSADARRCLGCEVRARAGATRLSDADDCPDCDGPKKVASQSCWPCYVRRLRARSATRPQPTCAGCGTAVSKWGARHCAACERERRKREPVRRKFNFWMAS